MVKGKAVGIGLTTAPDALPFIHGTVVFGKPFELQNHGQSKLDDWFHICDVAGAARKLVSLQDWNYRLQSDELEQLVRVFDVSDRFLYRRGAAGAAPATGPKPEKRFRRFKIAYHKDSQFRDAQNRMREAGAAKSQGVVRLLA